MIVNWVDSIIAQADYLEGSLKLYGVLGNSAWLLRVEIAQCSSVEVRLMEGCLINIFLEKMAKCVSE